MKLGTTNLRIQISPTPWVLLIWLMGWTVFQSPSANANPAFDDRPADNTKVAINFQTQVWPILQRKCLECHSDENPEGSLSLESSEAVNAGGHTGNELLGSDPEQSELFQRLISDDDLYRMPRDGMPLADSEIQTIRQWIEEGSDWPKAFAAGESDAASTFQRKLDWIFKPLKTAYERNGAYLQFLGFPIIAFLFFMFIVERSKKLQRKSLAKAASESEAATPDTTETSSSSAPAGHSDTKWFNRIGWLHYFAGLMTFVAVGFALYHFGAMKNAQATIDQLELDLARKRGERAEGSYGPQATRPVPPKPRHPKRMSGVYYRGNDERHPQLFNGGNYRTAEIEIWISDANGARIGWDESVEDKDLFVSMQIRRAPSATSALFTPRVTSKIYLSRQVPNEDAEELRDVPVGLITEENGESWVAHYQVHSKSDELPESMKGMIYLYQGRVQGSRVAGKIHYGIEYDLKFQDQTVSNESHVWMGSILNFGRRFLIPADNRITLSEWFSFRPIPEIEGENTGDPNLLGITEHLENEKEE